MKLILALVLFGLIVLCVMNPVLLSIPLLGLGFANLGDKK